MQQQAFDKRSLGKISVWDVSFCASLRTRNAHGHFTRATLWKFTRKMPDATDTTSIEHRALTLTVRTPQSGQTVWGIKSRQPNIAKRHLLLTFCGLRVVHASLRLSLSLIFQLTRAEIIFSGSQLPTYCPCNNRICWKPHNQKDHSGSPR